MRIIHALVKTMEGADIENGYVAFENGKITAVGPMGEITPQADDIDAAGGVLMPGIVEAHCHLGVCTEGANFESTDMDEKADPVSPQVSAMDALYPLDPAFKKALYSGVTTVVIAPGSAGVFGGKIVAAKTDGDCADKMVFDDYVGIKMAFGEPVLSPRDGSKRTAPVSRMGAAAMMRKTFVDARAYAAKKDAGEDVYDQKLEALLPVVRKEKPVYIRVMRKDDIMTVIRVFEECDIDYVLLHAYGAEPLLDILKAKGSKVIAGSLLSWDDHDERTGVSAGLPKQLYDRGMTYAIGTFSGSTPLRLPVPLWFNALHTAAAVKAGLPRDEALRAVTIHAAKICGIDSRVGSLKPGKDADFVLYDGDPLDYRTHVKAVFVNGTRKERAQEESK